MNKRTRLFIIATIAIITVILTGCAGSKEEQAFIGKWELSGGQFAGETVTAEQIDSEIASNGVSYFEFKKDEKANARIFGNEISLTWKIDKNNEDTIIIDDGSSKLLGSLNDDGSITIHKEDSTDELYFKKK